MLSQDERDLLKSLGRGEWKPIRNEKEEIEKSAHAARAQLASMRKDARISLRLNPSDIEMVRKRAVRAGLPYQTLIASVIHQFATNQLLASEDFDARLRRVIREELGKKEAS